MNDYDELKIYKQAVMDLIDATGYAPRTNVARSERPAKYVWMVHGDNPCDIRRYAYTHKDAIGMVADPGPGWTLYKLVRVNKRKP